MTTPDAPYAMVPFASPAMTGLMALGWTIVLTTVRGPGGVDEAPPTP